jgi:hypothetical protein
MLLSKVIKELETTLIQTGDCEVELQEKDTTCHNHFFMVVEKAEDRLDLILKLRSWPY